MANVESRNDIEAAFELLLESVESGLSDVLSSLTARNAHTQDDLGLLTGLAVLRQNLLDIYQAWRAHQPRPEPQARLDHVTGFALGSHNVAVHTWRDVLLGVCRLLYEENPQRFDDRCQEVGGRRPYFGRNGEASRFRDPKRIARSPWLVETNMSAKAIVTVVRRILTVCGHDPDREFHVYLRD